jgi:hypothetical protein
MKLHSCTTVLLGLVAGLAALIGVAPCHAQDDATAIKTADISAFGGYENISPAYGPSRNNGEGFGLNYTRYLPIHFQPSIEARVNLTNGTYVKERSYLIGFQGKKTFFTHYHPYADFLVGTGTIHFNTKATGYTSDNSIVYNYGLGVDIDLTHHFELRADYQRQFWSIGQEVNSFAPNLLLFGVNYTIPFRDYKNQADVIP